MFYHFIFIFLLLNTKTWLLNSSQYLWFIFTPSLWHIPTMRKTALARLRFRKIGFSQYCLELWGPSHFYTGSVWSLSILVTSIFHLHFLVTQFGGFCFVWRGRTTSTHVPPPLSQNIWDRGSFMGGGHFQREGWWSFVWFVIKFYSAFLGKRHKPPPPNRSNLWFVGGRHIFLPRVAISGGCL